MATLRRLLMELAYPEPDPEANQEAELKAQRQVDDQKAAIMDTDFARRLREQLGEQRSSRPHPACKNVSRLLQARALGCGKANNFTSCCKARVSARYLPVNRRRMVARFSENVFCGTHSQDGNVFMSTCQDGVLRFFDTSTGGFKYINEVQCQDVGWAVVDTAYSPDQQFAIYSSWSPFVHLITLDGERHEALPIVRGGGRLCPFSIMFSQDSREIIAGTNQQAVHIYDIMHDRLVAMVPAHDDDINAVCFADDSSNIFFSGSDDMLCKVWDRRTLSEENPVAVGSFSGHSGGITFIDSQMDNRHLLTQSKDHSIKLWDMRRMGDGAASPPNIRNFDYRFRGGRRHRQVLDDDVSLMTYTGHTVAETLIRARFSPQHSTGQRYIYSGSADGCIYVFDCLTGDITARLEGHSRTVRDVSWHPTAPILTGSAWDGSVSQWMYSTSEEEFEPYTPPVPLHHQRSWWEAAEESDSEYSY